MNVKKLNKGVSLIALIITIIILIILATAIILSLNNDNIIGNAKTAVSKSNLNTVEEAAQVELGTLLEENNGDLSSIPDVADTIKTRLNNKNIDTTGYTITYANDKLSVSEGTESTDWEIISYDEEGSKFYEFTYIGASTTVTLPCNTQMVVKVMTYDKETDEEVPTGEKLTLNIGTDYSTLNGVESELAFRDSDSITSIVIPNGMTTILSSRGTFSDFSNLQHVTLPNDITVIGQETFYNCTNLTSITLPDSLTTIGPDAFTSSGLTSITIPSSVTTVGSYAFGNCSNLTNITVNKAEVDCTGFTSGWNGSATVTYNP
jgi:Tfp pilus assembly protein PilE